MTNKPTDQVEDDNSWAEPTPGLTWNDPSTTRICPEIVEAEAKMAELSLDAGDGELINNDHASQSSRTVSLHDEWDTVDPLGIQSNGNISKPDKLEHPHFEAPEGDVLRECWGCHEVHIQIIKADCHHSFCATCMVAHLIGDNHCGDCDMPVSKKIAKDSIKNKYLTRPTPNDSGNADMNSGRGGLDASGNNDKFGGLDNSGNEDKFIDLGGDKADAQLAIFQFLCAAFFMYSQFLPLCEEAPKVIKSPLESGLVKTLAFAIWCVVLGKCINIVSVMIARIFAWLWTMGKKQILAYLPSNPRAATLGDFIQLPITTTRSVVLFGILVAGWQWFIMSQDHLLEVLGTWELLEPILTTLAATIGYAGIVCLGARFVPLSTLEISTIEPSPKKGGNLLNRTATFLENCLVSVPQWLQAPVVINPWDILAIGCLFQVSTNDNSLGGLGLIMMLDFVAAKILSSLLWILRASKA